MGYLRNHLATVTCGVFAAVLTGLWPAFSHSLGSTILDFVFMMAVPIMWFLVLMCWLSQKSADYMHHHYHGSSVEKKSFNKLTQRQIYTSDGKLVLDNTIDDAKTELSDNLDELRNSVKLKDSEIAQLKEKIANLETLVQIESLKSELANLKALASKK